MANPNPQAELERLIDANRGASDDAIYEMMLERCCSDPTRPIGTATALGRGILDEVCKDPALLRNAIDNAPGLNELLRELRGLGIVDDMLALKELLHKLLPGSLLDRSRD
jgi:hypothetical protein